ncbi:long-chain-fatty-acid--CoA ligase [Mycolicibacterium rufum]|uniref:Long-chain-fatty-acid--CoA ligase FadD13 n=1 Tax=Mycolicibacterium rufum TaxID=318424 RepID=A0A9X3BPN1_9MYCO|nr:long-chain-fatty-acid--CoA ligase [Mycolicibacterium rufum]KGI69911.1 long-chain fatty acid--CoA ligase [Mycolicibacterium rufum]MCV7069431.1 long-chain-fatty-acid--CoA ligase [Mycolicibacterium rufum]ULP36162.1 long-chain-fatty-acid--CoA ligase [Mycolicibacterium rufum]
MLGLMQDRPLMISSLIDYAAAFHGDTEIVSRLPEGHVRRSSWRQVGEASKQVANALTELGVQQGDRIATLAWNSDRHLALYFGVSGTGAVMHTVNPRLFPEQIAYIINHAEDRVLFFDITFAPLVARLAPELTTVQTYVVMTDREHMPEVPGIPEGALLCWDEFVGRQSTHYDWPEFDELSASSLCYTSGTTGNPKGVLYSHRSTMLHTLMAAARDANDVHSGSVILLVVPMFHANAWGTPYTAAMVGAKLVLPGPHLDGESVYQLMKAEGVNQSQGVPTVWMMLFSYLDEHPEIDPHELGLRIAGTGGAALPLSMIERFERDFGAQAMQGWGMTETSPLCVIGRLLPKHAKLSEAEKHQIMLKQGRGICGVELKIVDDDGNRLPWDGKAFGEVWVRGPWIASGYFKGEGGDKLDAEGFFPTGDVATIDPDGYLQLVDRAKDVIKSGGEWVSSIDLENAATGHPAVAEAAVIGVPHPKWQERPLLLVVLRKGQSASREEILDYLAGEVAKWWLPDDVVFVDELPHTATGKILKLELRRQYRDHQLPGVSS